MIPENHAPDQLSPDFPPDFTRFFLCAPSRPLRFDYADAPSMSARAPIAVNSSGTGGQRSSIMGRRHSYSYCVLDWNLESVRIALASPTRKSDPATSTVSAVSLAAAKASPKVA